MAMSLSLQLRTQAETELRATRSEAAKKRFGPKAQALSVYWITLSTFITHTFPTCLPLLQLRNQAEVELRALRAELVQKKISLSLTRSQQFAHLNPASLKEFGVAPVPAIPSGRGQGQEIESAAA